jgi:hypothetical protein
LVGGVDKNPRVAASNRGRLRLKQPKSMKHSLLFGAVAIGLVGGLSGCGLKKDTKAAEAEVDRFHQRWNADEFKAVHDEAHANFRNAQSADIMIGTLQGVKRNYGAFQSATRRKLGL